MKRRGFLAFLIAAPVTQSLPWKAIANVIEPIAPQAAATISLSLAEILAITMRNRREEIAANILTNNALLKRLKRDA